MNIKAGPVTFDRVSYDSDADVLYLSVGEPQGAAEFDESAEGHALRYDGAGRLVGITIVNARELLAREDAIIVTPPQLRLDPDEIGSALAAA
jgi:YD repeat-containing protein